MTGYVGTPAALKSTRGSQHSFVNRRFVRNRAVTRALDEAYKSVQTLHGTRYPAAVILIDVDPAHVDVNVSPTKTEVRFTREGDVYSAVYRAVQEALMAGGLVPTIIQKTTVPEAAPPRPPFRGSRSGSCAVVRCAGASGGEHAAGRPAGARSWGRFPAGGGGAGGAAARRRRPV